jgi:hypothetical protein
METQYYLNKYPYYRYDSSFPLQTVETIHGLVEYKINCRTIGGRNYVKGIDVFYDETTGKWVNEPVSEILDYETGQKVSSTAGMNRGIVEITDGKEVKGFYTPNVFKNCKVVNEEGVVPCIDYNILPPDQYGESYSEGIYYKLSLLSGAGMRDLVKKQLKVNHSHNAYNVEDDAKGFAAAIATFEKSEFPIDKDIKAVSRYLNDISFGAELETINGTLPPHLLAKYGVMICKDGSTKNADGLYPAEFVTVPLKGAKGLQTLRNLSQEIAKRSDVDIKCSYHLHLGSVEITRVFMVSLYRLCFKIQNDVFRMFPFYKTKPDGIKEKNYCKKLQNILSAYGTKDFNEYINNSFTDIFSMLSGGLKMDENYNIKSKRNPWGNSKWEMKTRYFWVNLINPIFGKHDTIEFRLHTPTLNPDKIINWLLMCVAIMRFAENNTERCIRLNTDYCDKLSTNLVSYYRNRVEYFERDLKNGDLVSKREMQDDNNFSFSTIDIK